MPSSWPWGRRHSVGKPGWPPSQAKRRSRPATLPRPRPKACPPGGGRARPKRTPAGGVAQARVAAGPTSRDADGARHALWALASASSDLPAVAPVPELRMPCGPLGAGVWVAIREGALAYLCPWVNSRLDHRGEEILTRRRSRRLIGRDATGARVHGHTPWQGVFQHAAVCMPVRRPRRGHEVLGDHRPMVGVARR